MKKNETTPATSPAPEQPQGQQNNCPVCGSDNTRPDYDSPESMLCCETCGSDFLIDGEVTLNARALDRPKEYGEYSDSEISAGRIPLDFDDWKSKQGQHTPGEWTWTNANNDDYIDIDCNGNRIASIFINPEFPELKEETKANAQRIVHCVNHYDELKREHEYMVKQDQKKQALIDELVEALRGCTDSFFGNADSQELYDKMNAARTALNKATQS